MNDDEQPEDQLARLADGSLPASRAGELRAQVRASPQLAAALDEQQRAVSLLRAIDVPAPQSLRARIEKKTDQVAPVGIERPPWRFSTSGRFARALALPIAIGLAIVVAAVVIVQGRGASAPTVPQTARLTLAAATLLPPARDRAFPDQLQLRVDGIAFPYWDASEHFSTVGAREDTVRGRRIVTVFYNGSGGRIGYAIVSGPPLREIPGHRVPYDGVWFTQAPIDSASLITWVRAGHTCVIAATSVHAAILLHLAESEYRN